MPPGGVPGARESSGLRGWSFVLHAARNVYARGAIAFAVLLPACGSGVESGPAFQVSFDISRGSLSVLCDGLPEIDRVEVLVFAQGVRGVRPGFPQSADCARGRFTTRDLPAGRYDFEFRARGAVGGRPDEVLFRATETLTVPDDDGAAVRLEPEVAYLTIAWTFGDGVLAPCGTEVDRIRVVVRDEANPAGDFIESYGCTDTGRAGVFLPTPFRIQEYTVQLDAESTVGLPLFTHSAQRLLKRGDNTYTAVLGPLGGQVFVDWEFIIGADRIRMCDAARVKVDRLSVRLGGLGGLGGLERGGVDFASEISCTESRPVALHGVRFVPGRELRLELSAAGGTADFYGEQVFTMPDRDYRDALVPLERVGSATVSIQVITSSCAPPVERVHEVRLWRGGALRVERETVLAEGEALQVGYDRLRYGTYDVEVTQRLQDVISCMSTQPRVIDARHNRWDPVFL